MAISGAAQTVGEKDKTLLGEVIAIVVGGPICVLLVLGLEYWVWAPITFWLGCFLLFVFSVVMVGYALDPADLEKDIEKDLARGELGEYYLVGIPYLHYWAAVLFFRGLWQSYGRAAFPTAPEDWGLLGQMAFVFDRFLGVVTFDAPDTFGFHVTAVRTADTFWLSLWVFLYKLVVSVAFIVILVVSYRRLVLGVRAAKTDEPAAEPPA